MLSWKISPKRRGQLSLKEMNQSTSWKEMNQLTDWAFLNPDQKKIVNKREARRSESQRRC